MWRKDRTENGKFQEAFHKNNLFSYGRIYYLFGNKNIPRTVTQRQRMANQEHVKIIKQGVAHWNNWRVENPDVVPDLAWANLVGIDLSGANLEGANMKLAFCRGGNLEGINFRNANLYGINLEESNSKSADMEDATLEGAHLRKADLSGANLRGANMKLANLQDAVLTDADFTGASKLTLEQFEGVQSLSGTKLDSEIVDRLKEMNPELF
jgi:uncharacterized protein YjbI with pentapeptide repeats